MRLIQDKPIKNPVRKPCLACEKTVDTGVHHHIELKGQLFHIRCADSLFAGLFLTSSLKAKKKTQHKIDTCLICGQHASNANGFWHKIVYNGKELRLKIHRTCLFNHFGMEYDKENKVAIHQEQKVV